MNQINFLLDEIFYRAIPFIRYHSFPRKTFLLFLKSLLTKILRFSQTQVNEREYKSNANPPISIQNSNAQFTTVAMKPLKYMIKDMENIVIFLNQTVFISVDFTLAEKPKMKIKNLNKQQYAIFIMLYQKKLLRVPL